MSSADEDEAAGEDERGAEPGGSADPGVTPAERAVVDPDDERLGSRLLRRRYGRTGGRDLGDPEQSERRPEPHSHGRRPPRIHDDEMRRRGLTSVEVGPKRR